MAEARLRELLDELHRELESSEDLDDDTRAQLREARGEIEEALAAEAPEREPPRTARERLERAIAKFEGEHPDGAAMIRRVLGALTDVGL